MEIEVPMIEEWIEEINKFKQKCIKLPRDLKTWPAYTVLKEKIENHKLILPII